MAIRANGHNTQIECPKHDAKPGIACWTSNRAKYEPEFSGHVCGSRYRKSKFL